MTNNKETNKQIKTNIFSNNSYKVCTIILQQYFINKGKKHRLN